MAGSRDVTPIISKLRNFLLQRKLKNHARFEDKYSPRSPPPPSLPSSRLKFINNSPYCKSDARRKSLPAAYSYAASSPHKLLVAADSDNTDRPTFKKLTQPALPGLGYNKETSQPMFEPPT